MDTCIESAVSVQSNRPTLPRVRGRTWRPGLRPPGGVRQAGRRKRPLYEPPGAPGGSGPSGPPARPSEVERETLLALMRYWPRLLELAAAAGVAERDAPDVAQLVILRALRAFRGEDAPPPAAWPSWLQKATQYVAREYRRARATGALDVRDPEELEDLPEDPPEERGHDDLAGLTLDDLRGMTKPKYWRVFLAYAVQGASVKDIAAAERIPEGTVYNRLRLARRDLGAAVERHRARRKHSAGGAPVRRSKGRAKG